MFCKNCLQIPQSSPGVVIVGPARGASCIAGLYNAYEVRYPLELQGTIDEDTFCDSIEEINSMIQRVWPCLACSVFAGSCFFCSLGGSLLIPALCTSQSQTEGIEAIEMINKNLSDKKIPTKWTLHRNWSVSWISIEINSNAPPNDQNEEQSCQSVNDQDDVYSQSM